MAKIAADSAVDTVFSSMMTKLDTQIASLAPGGPGPRGSATRTAAPTRPTPNEKTLSPTLPCVRCSHEWKPQRPPSRPPSRPSGRSKNKAERYSRTTALLRRAQLGSS